MIISRINEVEGLDTYDDVLLDDDEEQRFLDDMEGPTCTRGELFDRLLPPINHLEIPNASRRRAHTVDAARSTPSFALENVLRRSFSGDNDNDNDDDSRLGMMDLDLSVDGDDGDDAGEEVPATPNTDKYERPHSRTPRVTLSQEDRLRRRQKLLNSRCLRGFLLLFVYAGLVLQPSLTKTSPTTTLEPLGSPTALSTIAVNNTFPAAKTLSPPANLPRFHKRAALYHSTIPPNSSKVHWHKIPPTPPQVHHKKQRPILSHAHSYQLHQEPLVFGRELKTSFLADSSDFDRGGITLIAGSRFCWGTSLIWLSLLCLLCDTSYREWQHYRWHRQYHSSRGAQRSIHLRRSPSPVPPYNYRRFRQQLR
jgi:hypothetical protein